MADERLRSMNKFSFENQKHSIHKILKNRYLNRKNKSTCACIEYRNSIRNKKQCLCSPWHGSLHADIDCRKIGSSRTQTEKTKVKITKNVTMSFCFARIILFRPNRIWKKNTGHRYMAPVNTHTGLLNCLAWTAGLGLWIHSPIFFHSQNKTSRLSLMQALQKTMVRMYFREFGSWLMPRNNDLNRNLKIHEQLIKIS